MLWQLFVASRYLAAKRKEHFISIVSLISILGVTVGVAALIIVISVMSGFDDDLKDKIIGTYSHIEIVSDYGMKPSEEITSSILNTPHVQASSFFLNGQALVRRGDAVTGVIVKGIVPRDEVRVKKIGQYLNKGSLKLNDGGIVIGSELASRLGVKLEDNISLISAAYKDGKTFRVAGIFTTGMYEYDTNLVYIDMKKAQDFLGTGDMVSGVAVRVDDAFNVDGVKKLLKMKLRPGYIVRSWVDMNRNLLDAIKLEKTVMFIILTLIVVVACFNIASALIMTVLEKTKDIGILKAIGAANSGIMSVFAIQGMSIGILGTALGTILGVGLCYLLKTYHFINLPKEIYYIDKLPVKMEVQDILVIVVSSILISLLAAIYPAYRASKLDPVEALRYE